jgi:hypothetical protein
MITKTTTLTFEKSTKNTHKYTETTRPGTPNVLGCAYIPKWLVATPPAKLQVILNIPEDGAESASLP